MVEFMYVLLSLVVVTLVCIIMMNWYSDLDRKTKIEMVAREYMLRMETIGYLSIENEEDLIDELEAYGVTNILLTGSTMEPVEYGSKIYLEVIGSLEVRSFGLVNLMQLSKGTKYLSINIHKASTAKN